MATTVDTLIFELKVKDSSAEKAFDAWGKRLARLQTHFKGLATQIPTPFGLALSAVKGFASAAISAIKGVISIVQKMGETIWEWVTDSVKAYQQFEDKLVVARRTMSLTKEEADALGLSVRRWGIEMRGITGEELQDIAGIAGTLGLSIKNGEQNFKDFIETIAQLGMATDLTIQQAAANIPKILSIFQVATEDMGAAAATFGTVLDMLGNTSNATQSQILKVAQSMAGAASASGMTTNQLLALSATIASVSTRFGTAGAQMSQILTRLTTESGTWAEVLGLSSQKLLAAIRDNPVKGLQMVLEQLQKLKKSDTVDVFKQRLIDMGLSGVRTSELMSILSQVTNEYAKNITNTNEELKTQKTLHDEAAVAAGTLTNLWKDLQDAAKEVHRIIGKPLLEAISAILDKSILPIVEGFVSWLQTSESVQQALDAVAGTFERIVNESIAPIVQEFIEWLTTSERLDEFFAVTIPAGMRKVHLAFLRIEGTFKDFRGYLRDGKSIWEALVLTFPAIGRWEDSLREVWEVFKDIWQIIKDVIQAIKDSGITWRTVFDAITITLDTFTGSIQTVIDLIDGGLGGIVGSVFGKMGSWIDSANTKILSLIANVKNLIASLLKTDEVSQGESVWPDMVMWIGKNIQAVGLLSSSFEGTISLLNRIETATGQNVEKLKELAILTNQQKALQDITGIHGLTMLDPGYLNRSVQEQNRLGAQRRQAEQDLLFPTPTQGERGATSSVGVGGVTINIPQGSFIDETGAERLAYRIGRILEEQRTRMIQV